MKLLKHELFWAGAFYFLFLLSIALWVRDAPNQPDTFITVHELIRSSRMGDPASFATAAIDIAQNGWISSVNEWILNLWPPGFILLEALILKLMGPEAPVIFVLQVLAATLFSVALTLFYALLKTCVNNKAAYVLPLLIFAFPVSRVFLLQPTGLSLGESFSIVFFVISIFFAINSVSKDLVRYAILAGLCLALSAYFRSQFEFILVILTIFGIFLILVVFLTPFKKNIDSSHVSQVVKTIAVVIITAHVATSPWRIYRFTQPHYNAKLGQYERSVAWVHTTDLRYDILVATSEKLKSNHGQFVVEGAGNSVCRIDASTCGDEANAKELFLKTFAKHPYEWYKLRFDVIGKYWFSSVKNWVNVSVEPTYMDFVTNGLILFSMLVIGFLLCTRKVRSHYSWSMLLWFNASLLTAYAIIFSVGHFEVRYFYFPKIATIVMLITVISLYFRKKSSPLEPFNSPGCIK